MIRIRNIATLFMLIPLVSCSGEQDGPDQTAYADVQSLFARSCAGSACHIEYASAPAAGLDLTAGTECAQLIGVPSLEVPSLARVEVGNSARSYLLCKISPDCADRPAGASLMPLGLPDGLPKEDLDRVASWIDGGAVGCAGPDKKAPEFAGAASATPLPSAIRLGWNAASDDITPASAVVYLVYEAARSGGQDFATPTATTEPGATSFVAGGLAVSTRRFYVVRARDSAGNSDGNTREVSATTPAMGDRTPPTFAGVLSASPVGSSSLQVSWPAASDDVSAASGIRYRVYAATTSGGQDFGSPGAQSGPGELTTLLSGLGSETRYFVVVRAVDQAGNEDGNTTEISAMTGAGVSFSAQVEPIFVARCAGMACHTGVRPAQGLNLSAGQAYGNLVGKASQQCPTRTLVTPSQPGASYLMNKLRGVDLCFGSQMPKGSALAAADILLIEDWIRAGALDN